METKEEVKIEVKEATEEERTLKVGKMYLYNGVPVTIGEFFEIKLDDDNIPEIKKLTDLSYRIPTNNEMKTSGNEKEKGRIIGVRGNIGNNIIIIPDAFFGTWKTYTNSTVNDKVDIKNKNLGILGINKFKCTNDVDYKTINIEKIFGIYLYNDTLSTKIYSNAIEYSYNNGKVFAYGCVGIIKIGEKNYRKIIPDMSYFTWKVEESKKGGTYKIIDKGNYKIINGPVYLRTITLYESDNNKKNIEVTYNIYKINIEDCAYYFKYKSLEEHKYIVIIIKKDIYFVEINSDNDKLKYITDILDRLDPDIFNGTFRKFETRITNILSSNNILFKFLNNCVKDKNNILEGPKNKINELNDLLKPCQYELSLDYMYNLDGKITTYSNDINFLVLCLNKDRKCISSIELEMYDDYISINLKTLHMYENKKINTLLNAIVIIIGNLFNIRYIKAEAINPISAYILINKFKADIDIIKDNISYKDNNRFINHLRATDIKDKKNITLTILEDFKKAKKVNNNILHLYLTIELTDENIKNAEKIFNDTLLDPKFICNINNNSLLPI